MAKIKLVALLVGFLLCQAFSFIASAQCDNIDIDLSATATDATCYNNGVITVNITGADIDQLRLTDAEFRLSPTDGGVVVDWTKWAATEKDTKKTYSTAISGVYQLEMRAFCYETGEWAAQQIVTNVTVGGNYLPMDFSAIMSRKSMNCRNTGEITLNIKGGTPPYYVTVQSPNGDETSLHTSSSSYKLNDIASSDNAYIITARDECDYTKIQEVFVSSLSKDIPTTLDSYMAREATTLDCKSIIPQGINGTSDVDERQYWDNASLYYEYAYVLNGVGSKVWKELPNDKRPVFELPTGYKDFCDNPEKTLISYIRPKGCETALSEVSVTHQLYYVCPSTSNSPIFNNITVLPDDECDKVKLSIGIPSYFALCYPVQWSITDKESNLLLDSGTLLENTGTAVISNAETSKEYIRGNIYTMTLIDNEGRVFARDWVPPAEQVLALNSPYPDGGHFCSGSATQPPGSKYIQLQASIEGSILPGTIIEYEGGPQAMAMGDKYVIPEGYNSRFFYPTGTAPFTSSIPYVKLNPGTYTFNITPPCGNTYTRTITHNTNYHVQEITYEATPTCNGLKVKPTGGLYLIDANNTMTPVNDAYFRILSGPSGVDFRRDNVMQGSELVLPLPGTYTIGMMAPGRQNSGCTIGTLDIDYNQTLYIDPDATSAYHCEGNPAGYINIVAVNGIGNYTYTVTSADGTDYIEPQSNNTGEFSAIGSAGGIYNVTVKDGCNTSFSIPVTMLDLANARIVYAGQTGDRRAGVFCENSEILINSVSLGKKTLYDWTYPNGETSTEQRPRPIASYPESEGLYNVVVTPYGCAKPITDSLDIRILPAPQVPETIAPIRVCVNTGNQDIAALAAESLNCADCPVTWYDSATANSPIAAPTAFSTDTAGTTTFYISQTNSSGCESLRSKVTVSVLTPKECCEDENFGLQVETDIKDVLCAGATDGSITVKAERGTAPYTYEISGDIPENSCIPFVVKHDGDYHVFENLPVGDYHITVTDANGCNKEISVKIGKLDIPEMTLGKHTVKHQSCYGVNNGSISIPYTGNSPDYPVVIEVLENGEVIRSAQSGNRIDNLAPGDYNIRVRYQMSSQCAENSVDDFTINEIAPLSIEITESSHPTCITPANGALTVKVSGWAEEHIIRLNGEILTSPEIDRENGVALYRISALSGGSYLASVVNECGERKETSVELQAVDAYDMEIFDKKVHLDCDYSHDGAVEVTVSGNHLSNRIIYMLDQKNDTLHFFYSTAGASSMLFDELTAGAYRIVYTTTQEGCEDKKTEYRNITAPAGVYFVSDTLRVSCFGVNDGEISLLAHRGEWSPATGEKVVAIGSVMGADGKGNGFEGFTYRWMNAETPDVEINPAPQTLPLEEFWADNYGDSIYKGVVGIQELFAGEYISEVTIKGGNDAYCTYTATIPVLGPERGLEVKGVKYNEAEANCYVDKRRIEIELEGGWDEYWKDYVISVMTEEEYNNSPKGIDEEDSGQNYGDYFDDESNEPIITFDSGRNVTIYKTEMLMLDKGRYVLRVMDKYGCLAGEDYWFTIDPKITLKDISVETALPCPPDGLGTIVLSAEGGTGTYSYSALPNSNEVKLEGNIASGLKKGFYSFIATDSDSGCEGFNTFEIKEPVVLTELSHQDILCTGGSGELLVTTAIDNTKGAYHFEIDDTPAVPTREQESAGIYHYLFTGLSVEGKTLELYEGNKCISSLEFEIGEVEELKVNAVKGSEICTEDRGRLIVHNVSGGTLPYYYSLSENSGYQSDYALKAGKGIHKVFVKDANDCRAEGQGEVKESTTALPQPDFLVSTYGYSSDVLAVIDITRNPPATITRDSVRFYIDNELIYQEDPRIYNYGKFDELELIPTQIGIPDDVKATIVSMETKQEIERLWNTLKNTLPEDPEDWNRSEWTASDIALEKRFNEMQLIEKALEGYKNLYSSDVIERMSFISLKKDSNMVTLLEQKKEDNILLPFNITMKVYYNTGCDDETTKDVALVNDEYDPYPDGHIDGKQQDILELKVIPTPVSRYEGFEIQIEFANKVDFNISIYDVSGALVAQRDFTAGEIGDDMKATISSQEFDDAVRHLSSSAVVRVETSPNRDRAAAVILVKD